MKTGPVSSGETSGQSFLALKRLNLALIVGLVWFCLVEIGLYYDQGLAPVLLKSPDETVNRLAGTLIARSGYPILELPFPDPEDMLHPRSWLSFGNRAYPVYTPVGLYFYGALTWLGSLGYMLLNAIPGAACAAFAVGTMRWLPSRKWAGAFAPMLGLPALFWILRPWMNISPLLCGMCFAWYCWVRFREVGSMRWLLLSFSCIGLAVAVRPDYAPYALLAAFVWSLGATPQATWQRVFVASAWGGFIGAGLNLLLNWVTTGNAFRFMYQAYEDRRAVGAIVPAPSNPLVKAFSMLFFPMEYPRLQDIGRMLYRYWLVLPPVALLTIALLCLLPLWLAANARERVRYSVLLLLSLMLMLSRMGSEVFGAADEETTITHSIVRYWSPVYLFGALPPLFFLTQLKRPRLVQGWLVLVGVLGFATLAQVAVYARHSLQAGHIGRRTQARWIQEMKRQIPDNAVIFTDQYDKLTWSYWMTSAFDRKTPVELTVKSVVRVVGAGRDAYFWFKQSEARTFAGPLAEQGLKLSKQSGSLELFHVVPL